MISVPLNGTSDTRSNSQENDCNSVSMAEKSYCEQRLLAVGIRDNDNHLIGVTASDGFHGINGFRFFTSDDNDNLVINYLSPNGRILEYEDRSKNDGRSIRAFVRTRLKNPKDPKQKYIQPKGTEAFPFFTPKAIEAYKAKEKVNTLFIVEGEIKAFVLSKFGLCTIGIGGIYNFTAKDKLRLHPDLEDFIEKTSPREIVILHDADALQLKDFEEAKEATSRPRQFSESLIRFYDYLRETKIFQGDVFYEHILRDVGSKGIDDLLFNGQCDQKKCIAELQAVKKSAQGTYIAVEKITGTSQIRKYFGLDSVRSFYNRYQEDIGDREWTYNHTRYYRDDMGKIKPAFSEDLNRYMMVGPDLYKLTIDDLGNLLLTKWSKQRLDADFSNPKEFIRQIPKYDGFAYEPENDPEKYNPAPRYEKMGFHSVLYNRFARLTHVPKEGRWDNVNKVLHHIFDYPNNDGETLYEMALDYFQLLFTNPKQRLPILCLVSWEQKTGKSTLLHFLSSVFQENAVCMDTVRLNNKFNAMLEGKELVLVDEAAAIDLNSVDFMKMATTADELPYEPKGKDARRGKCFAKFVLCTNNETGFAPLTSADTRFWVIKVSPFEGAEDTEIEEKMKAEIPAFLHYLKNRKLHYPKVGRLYFDDSLFRTPALNAVIETSETPLVKNVKDVLLTQFFTLNQTVVRLSVEVLFELTKRQTKEADKSEVRRYLNDAVKKGLLAKGENTTFVYFDGKETQQGKSRIYIFHAKNWLNEEDYDELKRQIEEREHENSNF